MTWLVRAMIEQERRGCRRLHVVVEPFEDGLGGFSRHWGPHDAHAARWRMWHIVVPACALAGATVTVAPSVEYAQRSLAGEIWAPEGKAHLASLIVEAARAGVRIPALRATEAARRYIGGWVSPVAKVVTLTMRHQANDQARNANRAEWGRLAAWLAQAGYTVVKLEDTNDALLEGRGYAELDLDLRLALYERASMNVVGNNGPAALLWHSTAPYMRVGAGLPADWTENLGLRQGEQVPWATRNQFLVYGPDRFEVMRAAFKSWRPRRVGG